MRFSVFTLAALYYGTTSSLLMTGRPVQAIGLQAEEVVVDESDEAHLVTAQVGAGVLATLDAICSSQGHLPGDEESEDELLVVVNAAKYAGKEALAGVKEADIEKGKSVAWD